MSPPAPAAPRNLFQAVPAAPVMLTFQIFNAISFQIALGPPLVLLCRSWDASPLYIGAITSLVHWLGMVQIFLAPRLEYIGYQRVMLAGWAGRVAVICFMALLPFTAGYFDHGTLLTLLFASMFFFNLLRGLASTSWQPWLRWIVPEKFRGRWVSAEQLVINLSSAGIFFICGWILGERATNPRFGFLLLISALSGIISLYYLKKIPAPPPTPGEPQHEPMYRWIVRVWRDRPMRRFIRLTLVWIIAISCWGTFTIVFLRDRLHMSDNFILRMTGISTMGSVVSAWGWGILADRFGSRPILNLAIWILTAAMLAWHALAFELYQPDPALIALVYLLIGVGVIGFVVAHARYMLFTAPKKFPVLAITVATTAAGLGNGLAPLVWGLFLRAFEDWQFTLGPLHFSNYTLFCNLTLFFLVACKFLLPRLPERDAAPTQLVVYHIINDYPLRALNLIQDLLGRSRAKK